MKIKTKRGARRIRNQRVITRRFVTTYYTGCSYITAGKRYKVESYSQAGNPEIEDNRGSLITTYDPNCNGACSHLHKVGKWQWGVI